MTATEQDIRQVWLSLRNLAGLVAERGGQLVDSPEYRDARHMLQVTEGMSDRAYRERIEKLEHDNRSLLRQRDDTKKALDFRVAEIKQLVERKWQLEAALRRRDDALKTISEFALEHGGDGMAQVGHLADLALAPEGGEEGKHELPPGAIDLGDGTAFVGLFDIEEEAGAPGPYDVGFREGFRRGFDSAKDAVVAERLRHFPKREGDAEEVEKRARRQFPPEIFPEGGAEEEG